MALGKTPYFEDVAVGLELPGLEKGPLTTAHRVTSVGEHVRGGTIAIFLVNAGSF